MIKTIFSAELPGGFAAVLDQYYEYLEIQVLDRLTYQVRDTPAMYAQIERRYSSIAGAKSAIRAAIRRGNTVSA